MRNEMVKPFNVKILIVFTLISLFIENIANSQVRIECNKIDTGLNYKKNPNTKVLKINDAIVAYESEMTIDADGSPQAYHPQNIGLDNLSSAGGITNLSKNVIVFEGDKPHIQTEEDPFPGFYLSQTSLQDVTKKVTDYRRYVNSEEIPYIAIPANLRTIGVKNGDLAYVFNRKTGKSSFAIIADTGSNTHIGEGSIKLAENLGIKLIYKKTIKQIVGSDSSGGIVYLIFLNSGIKKPLTLAQIEAQSQQFNMAEINNILECL